MFSTQILGQDILFKIKILTDEERSRFHWRITDPAYIVPLLRLAVHDSECNPMFPDDRSVMRQTPYVLAELVYWVLHHNGISAQEDTPFSNMLFVAVHEIADDKRLDAAERLVEQHGKRPIHFRLWKHHKKDIVQELNGWRRPIPPDGVMGELYWRIELKDRVLSCVFPSVDDVIGASPLFTPEPELVRLFKCSLGRETFDSILGRWRRREAVRSEIPDLHEEFRLYTSLETPTATNQGEEELIAAIDLKKHFALLAPREQIIVQALGRGGPPEEIARMLGMTYGALRVAKSRLIKKLLMDQKNDFGV